MSDWEVVNSPTANKKNAVFMPDEWEMVEQPHEGLIKSLAYAPFRVAKDVGIGAWHGLQQIPRLWEAGKTEVPGLWDIAKNHKVHAAMQGLAGSQEAINNLNHIPAGLAEYISKRLHLLPEAVPNFLNNITPDTSEAINQLFDTPEFAGEKLIRGGVRNLPALIPGAKAGMSIGRGIAKIKPSNALRGNLTPEELHNNLRITQGTETGLGDVIGSPFLKRLNENILSKIPGSGVNDSLQKNAGKIINRAHQLLEDVKGEGNIENFDQYLNDSLKKSYDSHLKHKNLIYKNVNELADKSDLKLELPNFSNLAKKYKNAIEDTNILKYDPDLQSLIKKIGNYEYPVKSKIVKGQIVDKFGNPLINKKIDIYPRLEEANLLKGKLNRLANQHGASSRPSDRHLAGIFGDLARTLKKDIESAIVASGNNDLKSLYKKAETNYAKNFSPFLDKQIYKFINGNADPETLVSSFIKNGKATDRAGLINKLLEKLPEKDRNLLGYTYLQRALDENNVLNPLKLKTLLSRNALGPKQFNALFPNTELRNSLRDYVNLVDMNTKGIKLMQNPDTGQMNMDILPLLSKSPASLVAKLLGAPVIAKKLRSEKTRTKIVNKMAKNTTKSKRKNSLKAMELTLIGGHRQSDQSE